MDNINLKAQKDIPELSRWVAELLSLVQEIIQEPVTLSEEDHFGFMGRLFLHRQVEHIKSILILTDKNQGRDAELIARSMIEGLGQLKWAANDPQLRALRWRTFPWIFEWKTMKKKNESGESVGKKYRAKINDELAKYGEQFLTRKARHCQHKRKPLPSDPYCDNWTGHNTKDISDSVQGQLLHKELYKPFSAWHHWSPEAFGEAIDRDQNSVKFLTPSPSSSATALRTGFQCLLETVELVDIHFKLGFNSRITKVKEEYIKRYKTHNNNVRNKRK